MTVPTIPQFVIMSNLCQIKKPENIIQLTVYWSNIIYRQPGKILFVAASFFILNYFLDFTGAFLWSFFLILLVFKLDGRIAIFFALIALTLTPVLLITQQEAWAEETAIYAYFFLVIGVAIQIAEMMREKKGEKNGIFRRMLNKIRF